MMAPASEIPCPIVRHQSDGTSSRGETSRGTGPGCFLSKEPRILEILGFVERVAGTDATVLITGESGTGKEFIARSIHQKSHRSQMKYISVNSGAIADSLQESELFGHVKGAFTGAETQRVGLFEAANGGTIFFDEIAEMSRALQVKLLRLLQFGEFTPVGSTGNSYCNVRVIAATNQELRPLVDAGRFRRDLYYRLDIIRLNLPPLRERQGDIPLLANHFIGVFGRTYGKSGLTMSPAAERTLLEYDFPGNVRELENIIRRAVILCRGSTISIDDLSLDPARAHDPGLKYLQHDYHRAKSMAIEEFDRHYLTSVLRACGGIVSRAARRSGLSERNFHNKMKQYNIDYKMFRY